MGFKSLVESVSERPLSQALMGNGGYALIRDLFPISTWLAFGALAQGILLLVAGPYALLPVVILLALRAADTYLITVGWKRNTYADGVIMTKTSSQMPEANGRFSGTPASSQIVVFLIGSRNNHPLGLLAPGFKEQGDYFVRMTKEVSDRAEEFGFLGQTSWINATQRTAQNELMNVMYFKTHEGLDAYAHSALHREAWKWYNDTSKLHPHLSIFHETFVVPKRQWETIYINSHPSGFGSGRVMFTDPETDEQKFASTIVDATRGALRSGKGRMDLTDGSENDKYEPSAAAVASGVEK